MKFKMLFLFSVIAIQLSAFEIARKDPFQKKLDSISYYLSIYDTLDPMCSSDPCVERISHTQERIISLLLDVLNHPKILKYDLDKSLRNHNISHTASPDLRVQFFWLDEKTGGSYRSGLTIIHTRTNQNVYARLMIGDTYAACDYYRVYQLDSAASHYLALGSVQGCNTCFWEQAIMIKFNDTIEIESVLGFEYRTGQLDYFTFNDTTGVLAYSFRTWEDSPGWENTDEIKSWQNSGEFTYINGEFVQTSECWFAEPLKKRE